MIPTMSGEREYDLVLFGATGFTGGLTADYLAAHGPTNLRWALAGRNRVKLEAVAARLAAARSPVLPPALLEADAADAPALARIAESTKVAITTVGPYALYGAPLVAACAAAGTDYVDLTGEPEFVDRMYLENDAAAKASGARLVHCCGFDSVPHDLGAYFTLLQLPENVPVRIDGYVRSNASFSGGTYHSAINGFARGRQTFAAARERKAAEPRPVGRQIHATKARIRRDEALGGWTAPLPTIDGPIVRRSAALVDRYGPDFTYGHNVVARRLATIGGMAAGVGAVAVLAPIPPTRKLLLKAKSPGDGPSAATRAGSWFKIRFLGEGGGKRVVTEVSGGDPGYSETSKILAECGLCLAFDDLPERAGQLTTVASMGDMLLTRLQNAGIAFRVLETA
jgi:short subunit dehydrogenase-like uncharacterized protein